MYETSTQTFKKRRVCVIYTKKIVAWRGSFFFSPSLMEVKMNKKVRHLVLEADTASGFQGLLDDTSADNNVFATQTYFSEGKYRAVCFIREE